MKNINQVDPIILKAIPQRPPFLYVEKIVTVSDETIMCSLELTGEEWFFQGHFPGMPIFPGVLMQEGLFQASGVLAFIRGQKNYPGSSIGEISNDQIGVVVKVEQARFKDLVAPPGIIQFEVSTLDQVMNRQDYKGTVWFQGKRVAQVQFATAVVPGQIVMNRVVGSPDQPRV